MIISVTMNPSVDVAYQLETLCLNETNRSLSVSKTAGGKGINVAKVLGQLGEDVIATGVLGGVLGTFIEEKLAEDDIKSCFYRISGETRNSIALLHDKSQTEVLESGPVIQNSEKKEFLTLFQRLLVESSIVTVSGSLPQGLSSDFYQEILNMVEMNKGKMLLDTSGEALLASLKGPRKPYLIKPNVSELENLLGEKLDETDIHRLCDVLNLSFFNGIKWIVLSMGKNGALIKHGNNFYLARVPEIKVVSPVGSGDATLAGLASGIAQGKKVEDIITLGMVCGVLNTKELKTGHINTKNIEDTKRKIEVEFIK